MSSYHDWLVCLGCGYVIGEVVERQDFTCLKLHNADGGVAFIWRCDYECPECEAVRHFQAVPMSYIRLGLGKKYGIESITEE